MNNVVPVTIKFTTALKIGFGFYLGIMWAEAILQFAIRLGSYILSPAAKPPL